MPCLQLAAAAPWYLAPAVTARQFAGSGRCSGTSAWSRSAPSCSSPLAATGGLTGGQGGSLGWAPAQASAPMWSAVHPQARMHLHVGQGQPPAAACLHPH